MSSQQREPFGEASSWLSRAERELDVPATAVRPAKPLCLFHLYLLLSTTPVVDSMAGRWTEDAYELLSAAKPSTPRKEG